MLNCAEPSAVCKKTLSCFLNSIPMTHHTATFILIRNNKGQPVYRWKACLYWFRMHLNDYWLSKPNHSGHNQPFFPIISAFLEIRCLLSKACRLQSRRTDSESLAAEAQLSVCAVRGTVFAQLLCSCFFAHAWKRSLSLLAGSQTVFVGKKHNDMGSGGSANGI